MSPSVKHLIVDSGAFIKHCSLQDLAENIMTVNGAVNEIKDKTTLQRLQVLPYTLKIKEPSAESYKHVLEFSKKTGDYASLSAVDLQIIALTYEIEKEQVGTEHLMDEPSCKVTTEPIFHANKLSGFYVPRSRKTTNSTSTDDTGQTESEEIPTTIELSESNKEKLDGSNSEEQNEVVSDEDSCEEDISGDEEESSEFSDNDDSWITPNNIAEIRKEMGSLSLMKEMDIEVACITTDYSIQNVLLQMGLKVISVDGMLIREARVFILRCYSCFKTTSNMTKTFCPNCGNKTLKKVSVSVNEDGTKNIHLNFRRPLNIRGTRYSLPMPKGGKHAINPILCEDQPIAQNRPSRKMLQKTNVMRLDYEVQESPFALNDVYSRAANLGVRRTTAAHQRKNPNEVGKCSGNRKKRNKNKGYA